VILPIRKIRCPRLTMGQSLASIAVASLAFVMLRHSLRDIGSLVDFFTWFFFCIALVILFEFLFWAVVVGSIPPLRQSLGRPSWFRFELDADPQGIEFVEGASAAPKISENDDIHWVD
jgi:hypothetical protein